MGVDIPIDKLGNFPIVQFAVAIMVVTFGGLMMWRAFKAPPAPPPSAPEQRWYFEGPIAELFKQFATANKHLERNVERAERLIEVAEKQCEHMEEITRAMRDLPSLRRR
jgi:hypothetical protein